MYRTSYFNPTVVSARIESLKSSNEETKAIKKINPKNEVVLKAMNKRIKLLKSVIFDVLSCFNFYLRKSKQEMNGYSTIGNWRGSSFKSLTIK